MDVVNGRFGGHVDLSGLSHGDFGLNGAPGLVPVGATARVRAGVTVPMLLKVANISSAAFLSRPERDLLVIAGDRVYEAVEFCLREQARKGDVNARQVLAAASPPAGSTSWVYALQAYAFLSSRPDACNVWRQAADKSSLLQYSWSTAPADSAAAGAIIDAVCSASSSPAPSGHLPFMYHGGPVDPYSAMQQVGQFMRGEASVRDMVVPSSLLAASTTPSGQTTDTPAPAGMSTNTKIAIAAGVGVAAVAVYYLLSRDDEEARRKKQYEAWGVMYAKKPY